MHTLFLAPSGFGGGLNSVSLGLIRALERAGLKVGFFKPIAQPFPLDQGRERSCVLVENTLNIAAPVPLPLEQVERQLADGELDLLLEALGDALKNCRTLVWNGPLGAFEIAPFDAATVALAKTAAALTKEGQLTSVAGGGDTVAALNHAGVAADFSFVSTAGGAFLEWMEGKDLPGVKALMG